MIPSGAFTAAELADGTLVDWVNDIKSFMDSPLTYKYGTGTISDATNTSCSFEAGADNLGVRSKLNGFDSLSTSIGESVSITYTASGLDSGSAIHLKYDSNSTQRIDIQNGTNTITTTFTDVIFSFLILKIYSTSGGSISVDSIGYLHSDGHVSTWYDQSGNGNHASQSIATSQPKIVESGSYLGELVFDGVDDFLRMSSTISLETPFYMAFSLKADGQLSGTNALIGPGGASGNRFFVKTSSELFTPVS